MPVEGVEVRLLSGAPSFAKATDGKPSFALRQAQGYGWQVFPECRGVWGDDLGSPYVEEGVPFFCLYLERIDKI